MEPLKCPHCGKEPTTPLFRFCNHCNADIHEIAKKYTEQENIMLRKEEEKDVRAEMDRSEHKSPS